MAKNFPYFKFTATEWMTGDIVFEELSVQGLFINICALYWQRDGCLHMEDINKRFKNPPEIAKLTGRFFLVKEGFISINFLDEQLVDARHISKTNSDNGKLGGRPKGPKTLKNKPTAKRIKADESDPKAKKSKEEQEEELNKKYIPVLSEFLDHIKLKSGIEYESIAASAKVKYDTWVENGWKDGYNKPIKNWKSKATAIIPYLKKEDIKQNSDQPLTLKNW